MQSAPPAPNSGGSLVGEFSPPQVWGGRGAGSRGFQHLNQILAHILHLLLGHDAGKGEGQDGAGNSLGPDDIYVLDQVGGSPPGPVTSAVTEISRTTVGKHRLKDDGRGKQQ